PSSERSAAGLDRPAHRKSPSAHRGSAYPDRRSHRRSPPSWRLPPVPPSPPGVAPRRAQRPRPSVFQPVSVRSVVDAPRPTIVRLTAVVVGRRVVLEKLEQRSDLEAPLELMAHLDRSVDRVVVPAADPRAADVTSLNQVRNDPLRCPLGDADLIGDVAESRVRVLSDTEQHLGVAGHEGPGLAVFER